MASKNQRFARDTFNAEAGQRLIIKGRTYRLAGKIGDGAIGIVKRVVDLETERHYAVKFLAPEMKYIEVSSLGDIHARFKREGLRGAQLGHENILPIFAYEENENGANFPDGDGPSNPFILMELIQGKTLESYIKHQESAKQFTFTAEKFYIAYHIAAALVYLHSHGIVHRDVKPANIFISKSLTTRVCHAL